MNRRTIIKQFLQQKGAVAIVRIVLGSVCIVLGIVGLFLPILQGILFLVLGIVLLAPYIPFFARVRDWIYERWPRTERIARQMSYRFRRWSMRQEREQE